MAERRVQMPEQGQALRRLLEERRGVAAVEFAIILPLLLVLYFLTMEVSQAIDTSRKVGRIASQVGDLVTQQETVTADELDAIMKISQPVLQPYSRGEAEITVTAIRVTDQNRPKAEVVWSRKYAEGRYSRALSPGTVVSIPEGLMERGTFLVRAEAGLEYLPMLAWSADGLELLGVTGAFFPIDMGERYFLRPRHSRTVPCAAC